MSDKKINYLVRDYEAIKSELLKLSEQYYPELTDTFNDSSVGNWFLDLVASVGDDLSFHTDKMVQETTIDSATLRSSLMNFARNNGLKVPGRKASMCEVELSCILPVSPSNISIPDWNYAPIVQRTSIVAAGNNMFELTENCDFNQQFNSQGYSNRKIVPNRDNNGNVTGYTVTKSVLAINGSSKIYKKVLTSADIKPFMEVVLPENNVMEVQSVIFKETSEYTRTPEIYEFFIDAEEYRMGDDAVLTHRYFECDSLADQYRFGSEAKINDYVVSDMYNPEVSDEDGRYYRGGWKPLTQKFITEYTDNGYMKLIFGSGNGYTKPYEQNKFADYMACKMFNNDMLGILPKEGWSMYILYRIGGGSFTNLAQDSVNKIALANIDWGAQTGSTDGSKRGSVVSSLSVTNPSPAVCGKDEPSTDELKYLIKYNTSSQDRAVTAKDYKIKMMQMPPKYGAPFRCSVLETNNKVEICFLGLDENGNLDSLLPNTFVENAKNWLEHYRSINDYVELKSGRIYNIGVSADLFIDKNYNAPDVIKNVINTVSEYFNVENHEMGESIYLGDLEKQINQLDGVISLIELRVYKIHGGDYSSDECPLPTYNENASACDTSTRFVFDVTNGVAEEIDLNSIDRVLQNDYNSLFEIKNDSSDIRIRVRTA